MLTRTQVRMVATYVGHLTGMARAVARHLAETFPDTEGCHHPVTTAARNAVRYLVALECALAVGERNLPRG